MGNDHFWDTTKRASQRLPPPPPYKGGRCPCITKVGINLLIPQPWLKLALGDLEWRYSQQVQSHRSPRDVHPREISLPTPQGPGASKGAIQHPWQTTALCCVFFFFLLKKKVFIHELNPRHMTKTLPGKHRELDRPQPVLKHLRNLKLTL